MKILKVKPFKATKRILEGLERKGLIICFKPTQKAIKLKKGQDGAVDIIYTAEKKYGQHKLICVGKNSTQITLTTHPDNEEFIMINSSNKKYKPLFIVVGLLKQKEFENKARSGKLSAKDIVAIEMRYNSSISAFTMLKGTPHCEVTVPGRGQHPVFFVTEPSDFSMDYVEMNKYKVELK